MKRLVIPAQARIQEIAVLPCCHRSDFRFFSGFRITPQRGCPE
jgi:hypothetical protein